MLTCYNVAPFCASMDPVAIWALLRLLCAMAVVRLVVCGVSSSPLEQCFAVLCCPGLCAALVGECTVQAHAQG